MNLEEARAQFAAFPPGLQAAMKAAGAAERWAAEFWADETRLVADLLARSGFDPAFADALAGLYRDAAQPRPILPIENAAKTAADRTLSHDLH